jgi:hypothetical protein
LKKLSYFSTGRFLCCRKNPHLLLFLLFFLGVCLGTSDLILDPRRGRERKREMRRRKGGEREGEINLFN